MKGRQWFDRSLLFAIVSVRITVCAAVGFSYSQWNLNLLLVNSSIISASEYLWKVNVFLLKTQHSWRTEDRDVEEYQQLQQTVTARVQRAKAADLALKEEILQLLASISSIRCQSPSKVISPRDEALIIINTYVRTARHNCSVYKLVWVLNLVGVWTNRRSQTILFSPLDDSLI